MKTKETKVKVLFITKTVTRDPQIVKAMLGNNYKKAGSTTV